MTTATRPDLDFTRANTLYATHGLHAFAAKCPPPLARWAIEEYSRPGELVVDPFCGSGTTLVEARLTGRHSVGCDLDPLACLLSQVKAEPLDDALLAAATKEVQARATTYLASGTAGLSLPGLPDRDRWFQPEVSVALAALVAAIAEIETTSGAREGTAESVRRFCHVALSSLIVARTSVANARDLVHSRHHFRAHATPPDVLGRFARRCAAMRRQVAVFSAEADATATVGVARADARALPLRDGVARLLFTSPPYCNAIDYTRTHLFAIAWLADALGTTIDDYRRLGRRYIGTDRARKAHRFEELLEEFASTAARLAVAEVAARDPVRAGVLARYFADMGRALGECGRVLAPGGHAVLVVCPSRIRDVAVPTHRALAELAAEAPCSLTLVDELERTLDDSRRVMPYLQTGFGQRMRTEYILVLRRAG